MKIEMSNGWACVTNEDVVRVFQLDSVASVSPHENLGKYFFRVTMKGGDMTNFGPFDEKVAVAYVKKFFKLVGE